MPFFPPTVCRKFANVLDCVGCWREPEVCFFASAVLWKSSCCLLWFLFECTMRLVILNFPVSVPPRETCAMKTFTLGCNMFFRQTNTPTACYSVSICCCCDHLGWLIDRGAGADTGMHCLYWSAYSGDFRGKPIQSDPILFFGWHCTDIQY